MSPSELLENADAAMYRAKERGRARYEMFDEDMRVRAMARMRARRATSHGRSITVSCGWFTSRWLNSRSSQSVGVEALLAGTTRSVARIPPDEFIPVAEESGLIDRIGRSVIEEGAAALRRPSGTGCGRLATAAYGHQHLHAPAPEPAVRGDALRADPASGYPPSSVRLELSGERVL